jgi:hypothetical protein
MSKTRPCTGCEKPTTDFIVVAGQRLPYHPHCADQAWRDLRAIRSGGIAEALVTRVFDRRLVAGALPRAGEL